MKKEEEVKKFMESLSEKDRSELINNFKKSFEKLINDEQLILNDLIEKQSKLQAEIKQLSDLISSEQDYSKRMKMYDEKQGKYDLQKSIKKQILSQQNVVNAVSNGGSYSTITDAKGVEHEKISDFRRIDTSNISFSTETILIEDKPNYIPLIDEDVFRVKGYLFDAIRIQDDTYILALSGYSYRDNEKTYYCLLTLDQLVLTQNYYYTKAEAKEIENAERKNKSSEEYWDNQTDERKSRFLNQTNLYHSLPVKIQKTISKVDYEGLSWQEKEKIYKFFKRYRPKRLKSQLSSTQMWVSFHYMYESFINPNATQPKPRVANEEVWRYWVSFREMIDYKINDINIQRQEHSENYKQALETSFGDSNTNDVLKNKYGILVKRQNGDNISSNEITQIENAFIKVQSAFGNLKPNADKFNLKISHSGSRLIFASKAIGVFVPQMGTIGVSNKYGNNQFESTMSHEVGHFIDYLVGQINGKRYASDDYESTAGIIAFTFRNNMNKPKKEQTDYINATKECFARAFQQYFGYKIYGDDAKISHSYFELGDEISIYSAHHFLSKENFITKIVPLIEKFLSENFDVFETTIDLDNSDKIEDVGTEAKSESNDIKQAIETLELLLSLEEDSSEKDKLKEAIEVLTLLSE